MRRTGSSTPDASTRTRIVSPSVIDATVPSSPSGTTVRGDVAGGAVVAGGTVVGGGAVVDVTGGAVVVDGSVRGCARVVRAGRSSAVDEPALQDASAVSSRRKQHAARPRRPHGEVTSPSVHDRVGLRFIRRRRNVLYAYLRRQNG